MPLTALKLPVVDNVSCVAGVAPDLNSKSVAVSICHVCVPDPATTPSENVFTPPTVCAPVNLTTELSSAYVLLSAVTAIPFPFINPVKFVVVDVVMLFGPSGPVAPVGPGTVEAAPVKPVGPVAPFVPFVPFVPGGP